MATIINNPGGGDGGNNGGGNSGVVIAIVVAIVVLIIVFMFVLPNMRGTAPATNPTPAADTMQPAPAEGGNADINVDVPDQIDVNMEK